jgi:antitoxin component YwqK of YwqJK toxin-antitoxin module
MKRLLYPLLSILFLILNGCSASIDLKIDLGRKKSVDYNSLLQRGGSYHEINSEKLFSGSIIKKYKSGQYSMKGEMKDGKFDGDLTKWYKNGQISYIGTYKDGKIISEKQWNEDGSVKE